MIVVMEDQNLCLKRHYYCFRLVLMVLIEVGRLVLVDIVELMIDLLLGHIKRLTNRFGRCYWLMGKMVASEGKWTRVGLKVEVEVELEVKVEVGTVVVVVV